MSFNSMSFVKQLYLYFPVIYFFIAQINQALLCLGIRQKRRILQSFKIYSGFCAEIMLCATVFCLDFINCNTMGRNYHTIFLLQFGFQIFMRPQISSRNHPAGKTQLFRGNCYL